MNGEGEDPTAKARRTWDGFAGTYDRGMTVMDRIAFGGGRAWVGSRAAGEVLEVGIGTGLNLPFYPAGARVTGVDLSPAMLAVARRRAVDLGLDVDLREGDATELPFPDAAFDTVVCTLSLCAVPDDRVVVGELVRVLRPGGRLLLLDHVGSHLRPVWAVQRLIERFTVRSMGEHQTRRPLLLLDAAGLVVEESQRLKAGTVERVAARKPA